MAIYFRTKSGILVKEIDTPEGLVYITKDEEKLKRVYNDKKELIGFMDSKGNFIDDFVKNGKTESLALHKLSSDVYPETKQKQKHSTATNVTAVSDISTKARLIEKTKKGKKNYMAMFNETKNDGGTDEKKDQ